MGIKFRPNWKRHMEFPLGKARIERLLKDKARGKVKKAIAEGTVWVVQSVHQQGAPDDPDPDPHWRITIQVEGERSARHVRLTKHLGISEITEPGGG